MTGGSGDGAAGAVGPREVVAFWRAAGPLRWFERDGAFDAEITARFFPLWRAAADGGLAAWDGTPEGALALTIVLDQFPRNMFRGEARSYATDGLARAVADRAIACGFDRELPHADRRFLYLPFMHSETLADQDRCVALARGYGDEEFLKFAVDHADIVRRFGRFPHRNAMLGRATSADEQAFLDGGGFAG